MTLTVVVLDQDERFLQFLDTELVTLIENHEINALRTLKLEYLIENIKEAEELFKPGNKIWVQGDNSLTNCLYVINTNIEKDLFKDNKVTLEAEEVIVELNYVHPFLQTEVTAANGFTINKQNSKDYVKVNYYSLNYWFGDYFQIGVVQDCLTAYASRIAPRGIMTKMELLRFIEEETGNVFRARYEKDPQSNVIHRFLDFLNPDSSNSNWEVFLSYDIPEIDDGSGTLVDEDDNEISTTPLTSDEEKDGIEDNDDIVKFPENKEDIYYNPSDLTFRIIKDSTVLGSWNGATIGVAVETSNLIRMAYKVGDGLVCQCNGKTFATISDTITEDTEIYTDFTDEDNYPYTSISDDPNTEDVVLPKQTTLQVLAEGTVIHEQTINPNLGDVHNEVLDLGYNLENVRYDVDESDTFNAIMPILSLEDNDELSKEDMDTVITNWLSLEVSKGDVIPMIVQRVTTSTTKTTGVTSDYYSKPLKANDDATNNKYDYWAAVAYRTAPFHKKEGEPFLYDDTITGIEYTHVKTRPDINETRGPKYAPKTGKVETSEEDKYAIYNAVANKLREKKYPTVTVNVDVANYKDGKYNDYQLYDKVYLKLPGYTELITARVEKISRNSKDLADNTVTLGTYSINTLVPQTETIIYGDNVNYDYPGKGKLTVQLKDKDDNVLANKLLTFSCTSNDQNASPTTISNVITNNSGYASISTKYNPATYTVNVYYSGDELYEPCNSTYEISVGGELPQQTTTNTGKANKTSQKTASKNKTKTVKTYWSKCGISPDKSKIIAVGRPSASNSDMQKYGVNYNTTYKTIFANKCPHCGKAKLRFDGGKANKCITSSTYGHNWKDNVPEHEITCVNCDADYDCVTGLEKNLGHSTRLKMIKKPVKSNNSEFAKLTKGKLLYGTKKVTTKKKNNKVITGRTAPIGTVNKKVKEKALKIVDKKKDLAAAKAIAKWMGANIAYERVKSKTSGFTRSPENVLSAGCGNCCSQTRLMLQMMDAAGVTDKYKLYYIHIHSGSYGHVFARIVSKKTGHGVYVDPCKGSPWGHYINGKYGKIGSCPSSKYPTKPF